MTFAFTILTAFSHARNLGLARAAPDACGPDSVVKKVAFEHAERAPGQAMPYTRAAMDLDWEPYHFVKGWAGDKGEYRAEIVDGDKPKTSALKLLYPKGCTTMKCAAQAKSKLTRVVDSVTTEFRVKFNDKFDWVMGGKLPGVCGALCQTGCKLTTGLDGWSSRHMWRPCVWPPKNQTAEAICAPGEARLVAYVYHANKIHWCGDDFVFENFVPQPGEWYHIKNYVRMNTAGPTSQPENAIADGVLAAWINGKPALYKDDILWRRFTNVSIDTFYFSTFFGGSSTKFQATKDEHVYFSDILVREGQCSAEFKEPAPRPDQAPEAPYVGEDDDEDEDENADAADAADAASDDAQGQPIFAGQTGIGIPAACAAVL